MASSERQRPLGDEDFEGIGCVPGDGVLELGDACAHAGGGVGGVAPLATHGETALPQIVAAGKDKRVLLGGNGGQGEVVIAIGNGDGTLVGAGFERRRV
jgi:hypothetical protein